MSNKKKRSQAQIEASRKNGAKSKGPLSGEGKQASRRNALKHGLTAKFLKPQSDTRKQDRLYEEVYQELMNEYQPQGFTAESTVSNLSHDYVQMIRCRQMMETLQKPAALAGQDLEDWEKLQAIIRNHQSITAAAARIAARDDIEFRPEEALTLAELVADFVIDLEKDSRKSDAGLLVIEKPKASGEGDQDKTKQATDYTDDHEFTPLDEYDEMLKRWDFVKSVCRRLSDTDYLATMFRGQAVPSPIFRKRLWRVLKWIQNRMESTILAQNRLQKQVNALSDQKLLLLANEPDQIMRLERYLRDIERSIERKMKQLSELQSLGSFRENDP